LGITVPKSADTEVIGAGHVSASETGPHGGGKGNLVNPDDPVIHGGSDEIHKDGAEPPVEDLEADAPGGPRKSPKRASRRASKPGRK
jgi:hypothetical protein